MMQHRCACKMGEDVHLACLRLACERAQLCTDLGKASVNSTWATTCVCDGGPCGFENSRQ